MELHFHLPNNDEIVNSGFTCDIPLIAKNISGAPLPKAKNVTPCKF